MVSLSQEIVNTKINVLNNGLTLDVVKNMQLLFLHLLLLVKIYSQLVAVHGLFGILKKKLLGVEPVYIKMLFIQTSKVILHGVVLNKHYLMQIQVELIIIQD
jgi:hypothetical protein